MGRDAPPPSERVRMHHTAHRERESAAVAGGEAEIRAASGGQDDRVWNLQAMALPQPHRFQGDGIVEGEPGKGVQPGPPRGRFRPRGSPPAPQSS
jgi:hypothetical protein